MAIICPHCAHALAVKSVRAGRFTPKCSKCGQSFVLTVTLTPEPQFTTEKLPEPAPVPLQEPTVAPGEANAGNADFSVAKSALASPPIAPEATTALPDTSSPGWRQQAGAALEATEADRADPSDTPDPPPAAKEKKRAKGSADADQEMPEQLGNYQIIRELGRGGMGAVYLARQISLDRLVALKVMNSRWASNPSFVVRFTREAYAAAQLVHHNVVQVYDIGADQGINYFSMEFVEGQSLKELLEKEKRISAESAAGYILQAARGLQFAHERGMIHRDIKPDNLMLNNQGIVKVADLGLVRTPGLVEEKAESATSDPDPASRKPAESGQKSGVRRSLASLSNLTQAHHALGTPAYMAPEQARDSTNIDHRADIYSLGCTLYVLVTGRPVFQATTALEVMTKHASEPVIRPDAIVKGVPVALADIVLKMLAKKPDDRYASMDEVIKALEDYLGLHGEEKLAASEQHLRTLEQGLKGFQRAGAAQVRSWLLPCFFAGCGAVVLILLLFFGAWRIAGAVLGLGTMFGVAYFIVHGFSQRTLLFLKGRELVVGSSWLELVKVAVGGLLFVCVLYLVGLLAVWLGAAVVAIALALIVHYTIDRRIAAQRAAPLEKVERMLRQLRLRGLSEAALHEFVCRYSGDQWEEFFEALFGYEAKLSARLRYGAGPKGSRPKFAAWRDPLVRWIDRYQRSRQEALERKHLQHIEQNNLQAQGVDAAEAKEKAGRLAAALVEKAAEFKQEEAAPVAAVASLEVTVAPEKATVDSQASHAAHKAPPKRINVQDLYTMAEEPEKIRSAGRPLLPGFAGSLFGGGVRFLVGAVLLLGCLAWLHARNLLPGATNLDDAGTYQSLWVRAREAPPLQVPLVPEVVLQAFASINPGVAGLLLILSAIWRSWKIGLLQLVAAAVMVVGPVAGVPAIGPLSPQLLCLAAGGALSLLGFVFGRDT